MKIVIKCSKIILFRAYDCQLLDIVFVQADQRTYWGAYQKPLINGPNNEWNCLKLCPIVRRSVPHPAKKELEKETHRKLMGFNCASLGSTGELIRWPPKFQTRTNRNVILLETYTNPAIFDIDWTNQQKTTCSSQPDLTRHGKSHLISPYSRRWRKLIYR